MFSETAAHSQVTQFHFYFLWLITWCARQIRSRSCLCKNLATTSEPKVNDTPLSFSPQPKTSLSGSDQSKSHSRPWSGTSVGRMMRLICSMDWRSGESPEQNGSKVQINTLILGSISITRGGGPHQLANCKDSITQEQTRVTDVKVRLRTRPQEIITGNITNHPKSSYYKCDTSDSRIRTHLHGSKRSSHQQWQQ